MNKVGREEEEKSLMIKVNVRTTRLYGFYDVRINLAVFVKSRSTVYSSNRESISFMSLP